MNRTIKFRAWKEGKYEIGFDGSIWSNDFNNSGKRKQMKLYSDKDGYKVVWFTINGKRSIHAVRRLVAWAFHGERPKGLWINHKNGIRDDDRVENLEYVTPQYNAQDGWNRGRKTSKKSLISMKERFSGVKNPKAKLNEHKVFEIRRLRAAGQSLLFIAEQFGISRSQVSAICNNNFWENA